MKKIVFFVAAIVFLSTGIAQAAPGVIFQPSILPITTDAYDLGSSTPSKEWNGLYVKTICLSGDCKSAWPVGGAGSGVWPFTTTDTNFGVAVQSTTTPEWFQNGLMASSTSYFPSGTWSSTGNVGINTTVTTGAWLTLGTSTTISEDPVIDVTRDFFSTGNGHAFADNSVFARTGSGDSYASFDAEPYLTKIGTDATAHYGGVQVRPIFNATTELPAVKLFRGWLQMQGTATGIVDNLYMFSAEGVAYTSGTVKNMFGFYVPTLPSTEATTTYGVYVQGNQSYFGASTTIGDGTATGGLLVAGVATTTGSFVAGAASTYPLKLSGAGAYPVLSAASGATGMLINPNNNGSNAALRMQNTASALELDATDPTGVSSYKTLTLNGSGINLFTNGGSIGAGAISTNSGGTISAGTLSIANGGTNATALGSHMILAFDGTSIVASSTPTAARYLATSTLLASTFPFASTTAVSATTLCLTGDTCRTTWPSSSAGVWSFNKTTNFSTTTAATTTPFWFQMGLYASSTSQFVYASTTALSATTLCLTGDTCLSAWPTSGGGTWSFTKVTNFGTTTAATTTPFWYQMGLHASSTSELVNLDVWNALRLTATTSAILTTDQNGYVVASTSINAATISGSLGSINGTALSRGGSISINALPWTSSIVSFATTTQATSTPFWFSGGVYASSTSQYVNLTVWNALQLPATTSALLSTDQNGFVVSTSTINANLLSTVPIAKGGTGATSYNPHMLIAYDGSTFVATSTPTAARYLATSTLLASSFPFASTTALSATTLCLTGDVCKTAWPSVTGLPYTAWGGTKTTNFATSTVASTTVGWFQVGVHASSTSELVNADIWNALRLIATTSALLSTDQNGYVVSTSTISANLLSTVPVSKGGTGATAFNGHMLLAYDGANIVATSSPTAAVYFATSSTMRSIFPNASTTIFTVGGGSTFFGNASIASIGSSTPSALWGFTIGTTTMVQNAQFGVGYASSTTATSPIIVDWDTGNNQRFVLSANTNIVINATSSHPRDGAHYVLKVCQDSVGSRTLTFITPAQLRWADGTTTISATANTCSLIGMIYDSISQHNDVVASSTGLKIN